MVLLESLTVRPCINEFSHAPNTSDRTSLQVHKQIKALYEEEGTPMHKHWEITGYYNRGIFFLALQLEAVRNAIKLYGLPVTGENVKKGYEHIKGFTMGGFLPPMEITPEDHEGGGWVRVYQWDGAKFVLAKDWYKAHRDVIKAPGSTTRLGNTDLDLHRFPPRRQRAARIPEV